VTGVAGGDCPADSARSRSVANAYAGDAGFFEQGLGLQGAGAGRVGRVGRSWHENQGPNASKPKARVTTQVSPRSAASWRGEVQQLLAQAEAADARTMPPKAPISAATRAANCQHGSSRAGTESGRQCGGSRPGRSRGRREGGGGEPTTGEDGPQETNTISGSRVAHHEGGRGVCAGVQRAVAVGRWQMIVATPSAGDERQSGAPAADREDRCRAQSGERPAAAGRTRRVTPTRIGGDR